MKVRWTQDSLRLRITPGELEALQERQVVREEIALPGGGWAARVIPGVAETSFRMSEGDFLFYLSVDDLACLAAPDTEGVYFQSEGEPAIRYYIEKDFPCVHPRASEAMEPPTATFDPPDDFEQRKSDG